MAVTGLINPKRIFANTNAKPGDRIFLTKPIGSGILTTGGKNGATTSDELSEAFSWISMLIAEAARLGHQHNVECATDITGFGLAGHLFNIAKASKVTITIKANSIPLMSGARRLYDLVMTTGGAKRNRQFLGENLVVENGWWEALVTDPQTRGGLALFTTETIDGATEIGHVIAGPPTIVIES
jgi:selenide,water dikinase